MGGTARFDIETMSLRVTLDFLLYDWLHAERLTQRTRFADHSRDTFDAVLDTCERIAREKYAPFNRLIDTEEPRTETTADGSLRVVLPQATHAARAAYAESGMLAAAQDAGTIGSHPFAGHLSHQYRVSKGGVTDYFDHVEGYGWAVISAAGSPAAVLSEENLAWAERNGAILVSVGTGDGVDLVDVDGGYARWFDELGADTVIVRPDFYTYDAGSLAGLDAAVTELRRTLHATAPAAV